MIRRTSLPLMALLFSTTVAAVDFGVMETADPIARQHWKFIAYPLVMASYPSQEQRSGVNVGIGYGLHERWDVELQYASYDDEVLVGTDLEFIAHNGANFDASFSADLIYGDSDFGDLWGYGATAIASYTRPGTWLTFTGALDTSIDHFDFNRSGTEYFGTRSEGVHVVPGVQYRISESIDVIGEIGLGLTGDARDYAALGVSYYFRRTAPAPR